MSFGAKSDIFLLEEGEAVQGDHSGCAKPPVDFETNILYKYEPYVLKRNLCFIVNMRFGTT